MLVLNLHAFTTLFTLTSRPAKTMKLTLSTRSKIQIQTSASYQLELEKKHMKHAMEAYLFAPKSLAINVHTYPKYPLISHKTMQYEIRLKYGIISCFNSFDCRPWFVSG